MIAVTITPDHDSRRRPGHKERRTLRSANSALCPSGEVDRRRVTEKNASEMLRHRPDPANLPMTPATAAASCELQTFRRPACKSLLWYDEGRGSALAASAIISTGSYRYASSREVFLYSRVEQRHAFLNFLYATADARSACVDGAGHFPHRTHADQFNRHLRDFLAEMSPS